MIKCRAIPEQNKTVAKIEGCEKDAINFIKKRAPILDWDDIPEVKMKKSYKSTVICSPKDTFVDKTGEDKARERVAAKYHRDYDRAVDIAAAILEEIGSYAKELKPVADTSEEQTEQK